MKGMRRLAEKTIDESKKSWHIAGPAILTGVLQFSISFITTAFVGHLGSTELAAVTIAQNVIEGFAYGVLLGMGSALETLCGQAVGAGQLNMLGIYMQRSCIISLATALLLTPVYVFTTPILKLIRQSNDISELAGKYAVCVIPQLFAYALNFPLQKFFQSQSKVWVMAAISGIAVVIHTILNWVFVSKLGHGLVGAAVVGNFSWWFIVLAQVEYMVSGYFPESWTGFSKSAFQSLSGFVRLSLASAIMLCLELWYYTAVLIMVGYLKNPSIQVSAMSICMNIQLWTLMVALGFNASISVRVSNELGAGHPKAAKFAVAVNMFTAAVLGIICTVAALVGRNLLPRLFSEEPEVVIEASRMGYLLAATILLSFFQPVLSGVAVGAGWQSLVAFLNIGCYYLIGLPIGAVLGFNLKRNAMGIWSGMLVGSLLQTAILLVITLRTKWENEALQVEERIKTWGGRIEHQQSLMTEALLCDGYESQQNIPSENLVSTISANRKYPPATASFL